MLFRPMNIGIDDIYLDYIPAERNLQIILRLALADEVAYAGVNKGYAARGVGSNSRKACRTRRWHRVQAIISGIYLFQI